MTTIQTLEDAESALQSLGQIEALEAQIDQQCNDRIALQRQHAAGLKTFELGSRVLSFADARSELEASLETYANTHRSELLVDAKSRKLRNGTIGWRKSKDSLEPCEGHTEASVLSGLRNKVSKFIVALINGVRLLTGLESTSVITFEIKLNKTGLLSAMSQQQITHKSLEKIGLRIIPGEDQFFAKPAAPVLDSHEAAS